MIQGSDMSQLKLSLAFLREFKKDYSSYISKLIAEHGGAFMLKGPQHNLHIFSDPNYIKHILSSHFRNYVRPPNAVADAIVVDFANIKSNETWQHDRMDVLNPLLTEHEIKQYVSSMTSVIVKHLDRWENYTREHKPLALTHAFSLIALENLLKTFFGDINLESEYIIKLISEMIALVTAYELSITKISWLFPTSLHSRTRRLIKQMHVVGDAMIEHCLSQQNSSSNIISLLVKHASISSENVTDFVKIQLRREVLSVLTGGFESLAGNLAETCRNLSLYPMAAEKLYTEVKNTIGNRVPSIEDVDELVYTRATLFETLRLSALPFLPRFSLEDDMIKDYAIKKHDRILVPIFYMHKLSQYWDNPEGFEPARFLQPLDNNYRFVYLAFSSGPRGCPGRNFALLQSTLILAMLVQRYKFQLVPHQSDNSEINSEVKMILRRELI